MTSLDNIEKLIQMATIEHMYSMLNKLTNETNNKQIPSSDYSKYQKYVDNRIENISNSLEIVIKENKRNNETIHMLTTHVRQLEEEINQIRSNTNNNSKYLCQQIRGQQVLTSYPGFSNSSSLKKQIKSIEEEHIRLKIEEKEQIDKNEEEYEITVVEEELEEEDLEEEEVEEEEVEEEEVVEEELEEVEEEVVEEELEEVEVVDVEEEVCDDHHGLITRDTIKLSSSPDLENKHEEESEEESEEEVGTEDENENSEPLSNIQNDNKQEEAVEEEEVLEEVVEEEDEEVFEIEIDDVTYFTTDEENGILYEVSSDGEVGNKVGIIKNGEPIFS